MCWEKVVKIFIFISSFLLCSPVSAESNNKINTPLNIELQAGDSPIPILPEGSENGEIDNKVTSNFGIAYVPKLMISKITLGDNNPTSYLLNNPFSSSNHIGVKDTTRSRNKWTLYGRLDWLEDTSSHLLGTSIKIVDGKLYKNNNGILSNLTDFEVIKNDNVKISSSSQPIMHSDGIHIMNGVFDYSFSKAMLDIPDINNIPAGNYYGKIEWNLSKVPDDTDLNENINIIEQKIDSLFSGENLVSSVTQDILNELQSSLNKFNDSDKKKELQAKLDRAKKLLIEKKYIKEIMVTERPINNLNAGINMGNGHDRQDLGIQIKKGSIIKIKQINPNYKSPLILRLLTNDSNTESSISFSNQEVSLNAKELAVPFIDTPYKVSNNEIPQVEYTVDGEKIALPIFDKNKKMNDFVQLWQDTKGYALITGDRFQILFPQINMESVISRNLIDLISMYDNDIIGYYNNLIGLSDNPDNPLDKASSRRYFYKADANGAGALYYGSHWAAQHSVSASSWLSDGWGVLHETGHGYQGNFMNRGMSVGEVWNNLYGVIYNYDHMGKESADKNGWLYDYGNKKYYESMFLDMIRENNLNYEHLSLRNKLNLLSNIVDKAKNEGLQNFYKKYRYLASKEDYVADQYLLPDLIVKYLGESNKYDFIPILKVWGLNVEKNSETYVKENNYKAVAHLAQVVPDNQIDNAINKLTNDYRLSSVLSLVTNEELKALNLSSTITLNLKNYDIFKNAKLRIFDNRTLYKEINIESSSITLNNIPNGVYELEFDTNEGYIKFPYLFVKENSNVDIELINYLDEAKKSVDSLFEDNSMLIKNGIQQKDIEVSKQLVSKLPSGKEKEILLDKLEKAYDQLFEITLSGFSDRKFAVLDISNNKANIKVYGGMPHVYFKNDVYASLKIERNSNLIYEKKFIGDENIVSSENEINLEEGDRIIVKHQEASGNRFSSNHLELKPDRKGIYYYKVENNQIIYDYIGESQQCVEDLFEDKTLNKIKFTIQQKDIEQSKVNVNNLTSNEVKDILLNALDKAYQQLQEISFLGLGNKEFASLTVINKTAILRINSGSPHVYFADPYASIKIERNSKVIYKKIFIGDKSNSTNKEIISLQEGDVLTIIHREPWRLITNHSELKLNNSESYSYIVKENKLNIYTNNYS
ncbi:putative mucin/carbohydrate-binding domain-containing protein [Enterococcus faecalis]|uniref:putative mucin/carbohydrate-binding domain-containing protein n=1 Tax=Enterococcus faecalis TaxID=1351 RepID=UPI001A971F85|nr:putative mucin/carbohydrate-binding domain-containing protein [Enterococcus faecalis]MBO1137576.1 viral enhancin protein [Enterococcus faecalis]